MPEPPDTHDTAGRPRRRDDSSVHEPLVPLTDAGATDEVIEEADSQGWALTTGARSRGRHLPADGGARGGGRGGAREGARGGDREGAGGGIAGAVRRHPLRSALVALGVVIVGLLAGAAIWYEGQIGGTPGGAETVVSVASGSSLSQVAGNLARDSVIGSTLAFRIYLVLHGSPVVKPGDYLMNKHESFGDVRSRLAAGPDVFALDVPPGFTVEETATRVGDLPGHDSSQFLSLATSGAVQSPWGAPGSANLEGLLGTGTYTVLPGESDKSLLEQMVQRFDTEATSAVLAKGAAALGVTPYQAITIASIVQKEGVYQENLAKVSRVIYNRLARGMDLQMDSTVLYAEHRDGGPVTSADLALNTPYNTYLHAGLTPTPICFPSPASLAAALAPAPGNWLYFVVVSQDGTEAFSDTLAGQQANEQLAKSRGLG